MSTSPDMISTAAVIDLADAIVTAAIGSLADLGGPDVEQAFAYDLAHAASAVATARSLLDYGAKGDSEARIACVFTADVLHDLAGKILGREALWGVAPGALDGAAEFIAE
ncbi:MAG: acyl-CoA dehydrogenase, partial [Ilumatobacteraceae bacterium]